jgi:hypothetical protein
MDPVSLQEQKKGCSRVHQPCPSAPVALSPFLVIWYAVADAETFIIYREFLISLSVSMGEQRGNLGALAGFCTTGAQLGSGGHQLGALCAHKSVVN